MSADDGSKDVVLIPGINAPGPLAKILLPRNSAKVHADTEVDHVPVAQRTPMTQQPVALAKNLPRIWLCKNGHILGVTFREKQRKGAPTLVRLLLFRLSLMPDAPVPPGVAFAKIDQGEVLCGICGDTRKWYPAPH